MILIVAHHYAVHGALEDTLIFSSNKYILDFLSFGGKLGVNCFVLITGYFMCNSQITIKKILTLMSEVWFYSIVILILFLTVLQPIEPVSIEMLLKSLFPVTYSAYWFATTYIVLMILSPFINKLIDGMNRNMHRNLLLISIMIWCVLPTFMQAIFVGYNNLIWFIVIYLLAAYISKYISKDSIVFNKHLLILVVVSIMLFSSIFLFDFIGNEFNVSFLLKNSTYFTNQYSFLLLIMSMEMFLISLKGTKTNKIVNRISSATLAIYLIHDNFIVRLFLWKSVFDCKSAYYSNHLLIHALCSISIVFFVCLAIELIRQKTIGIVMNRFIDSVLLKMKKRSM